jgi:MFS family permease
VGDALVTRFGDRAVARVGASISLIGMTGALLVGTTTATIAAFALVGLGIGTLIPAALRTAEALPGISPGTGIAWVSTVIRVGLLASPPLVGLLADLTSLRMALGIVPIAALTIIVLSRTLAGRVR